MYHEMYQSIFDYEKDFRFYDAILKEFGCSRVLEAGCGSGNLAKYIVEAGYDYVGCDLSEDMLGIARENNQDVRFFQRDMRELGFDGDFDAVLITGRSFTYMTRNDDVRRCLDSVHRSLKPAGVLVFDNFNASELFSNFQNHMEHVSECNGKVYRRISDNSFNLKTGWTWNWDAKYYVEKDGSEIKAVEDKSVLRAFTEDELELFLKLCGFNIINVIKDGAVITIAAQKA